MHGHREHSADALTAVHRLRQAVQARRGADSSGSHRGPRGMRRTSPGQARQTRARPL